MRIGLYLFEDEQLCIAQPFDVHTNLARRVFA